MNIRYPIYEGVYRILTKNPTRNNLVLVTERMREQPFDNDELQPINKRLKDILP